MKNYIGFSRDHSASMRGIAAAAARDYNRTIATIQKASERESIDTIVSTVKCGAGRSARVEREVVNSTVAKLKAIPEYEYETEGYGTPLYDSVGELIDIFEKLPDAKDPTVAFQVIVITDGGENSSIHWNASRLRAKIAELHATDRWTFIFQVPPGQRKYIMSQLGLFEGNVIEWETTAKGRETATVQTTSAIDTFYSSRSMGATSTRGFYSTNAANLTKKDIQANLIDISNQVKTFLVLASSNGVQIRDFVEKVMSSYVKGTAFYQLMKPEKEVQEYKKIVIRDRKDNKFYGGSNARALLGLPENGTVRVAPGDHGSYDIFIQSTSVNRKVVSGTQVLIWDRA